MEKASYCSEEKTTENISDVRREGWDKLRRRQGSVQGDKTLRKA